MKNKQTLKHIIRLMIGTAYLNSGRRLYLGMPDLKVSSICETISHYVKLGVGKEDGHALLIRAGFLHQVWYFVNVI